MRPALLLVLVAAVWARAVGATFFWDDHPLVVDNPLLRDADLGRIFAGDLWSGSAEALGGPSPFFRPLVLVSFLVDRLVGGLDPRVHHLQSVGWHLLAVGLLVALARPRVGEPRALVAGAILGLHPLVSEAVVWVAARNDVMCGALVLAALLAFDRRRAALGGLLVAAATLSKEAAVVMPALLVAWRLAWGERPGGREGLAAVLGVGAALLLRAQATLGEVAFPPIDPALALVVPGRVAATVLGWLVLPWPLTGTATFYMAPFAALRWGAALVALVGLLALVRARPGGWALLAWAGLAWLPTTVAMLASHAVGERFLYLPLAGLAVLVAAAAPARLLPVGILAGIAAIATVQVRLGDWRSEDALWTAAVTRAPDAFSWYRMGVWAESQGHPRDALHAYRAAIAADPPLPFACPHPVRLLVEAGAPEPALQLAAELRAQGCEGGAFEAMEAEAKGAAARAAVPVVP